MKKVIAVVLVVLGTLALVYRGFSYTRERHEADFGPISLRLDEKKRVDIPVWAGVIAIAGGIVLLVADRKR